MPGTDTPQTLSTSLISAVNAGSGARESFCFNYLCMLVFPKSVCKVGVLHVKLLFKVNAANFMVFRKRVLFIKRSLCWWCHCKGNWISMAHDNYRDRGYPLCSSVLFPSKSTCQRRENGKPDIFFAFFLSVKWMITYFYIFASKFPKMGPVQFISLSCITFVITPSSFSAQDV